MITEKQMKIVGAVNATMGSFPHDEDEEMSQIIMAKQEFDEFKVGSFAGGNSVRDNECWEVICTIEEYSHCIEEMKYHYDIPKWCSYHRADKELLAVENSDYSFYEKETFVYGQDVYVNDKCHVNEEYKFGCLTLDSKKALLFGVDGNRYYRFTVGSVSSKPIKSKEDIELEVKKKQVDDYSYMYSHYFKSMDVAKKVFSEMQECGRLAEIKLKEEE